MSVTLPADVILSKNKLYQNAVFIELLEWQISETSETVRLANYNEDFIWAGETWSKFWFEGGDVSDTGGDKAETLQVRVSAVDKVVQEYLEELDAGGIGDTVIYRRVHSEHLGNAFLTATYEILNIDAGPNNEWVVFDLGQENLFLNQFPAHVTSRDLCRYKPFDTDICPYTNNILCSRSFDDCIWLGQESVFGGQPGIPGGIFNIESFRSLFVTSSLDAKLNKSSTMTMAFDAIIGEFGCVNLDALLNVSGVRVAFLEAILFEAKSTNLDALLNVSGVRVAFLDAELITADNVTQTSLDAKLNSSDNATQSSLDAIIKGAQTESANLDALLNVSGVRVAFLDAVLDASIKSSTNIDALIKRIETEATNIDALLNVSAAWVTFLEAELKIVGNTVQISLDAKINISGQTISFGIDAQLYELNSYYEGTKLDAILFGDFVEQPGGGAIEEPGGGDYVEEPS